MELNAVTVTVNGKPMTLHVRDTETLLEALRERGFYSVRESCGQGLCGSCTVLIDGRPVSSCLAWAALVDGADIRTAEGLESDGKLDPLQTAFIEKGGFQCGFCTPGMLMMARALLDHEPDPSEKKVREYLCGNLCRCGAYPEIVSAIMTVAYSGRDRYNLFDTRS